MPTTLFCVSGISNTPGHRSPPNTRKSAPRRSPALPRTLYRPASGPGPLPVHFHPAALLSAGPGWIRFFIRLRALVKAILFPAIPGHHDPLRGGHLTGVNILGGMVLIVLPTGQLHLFPHPASSTKHSARGRRIFSNFMSSLPSNLNVFVCTDNRDYTI